MNISVADKKVSARWQYKRAYHPESVLEKKKKNSRTEKKKSPHLGRKRDYSVSEQVQWAERTLGRHGNNEWKGDGGGCGALRGRGWGREGSGESPSPDEKQEEQ